AAEMGADLCRQLLTVSGRTITKAEVFDLNESINGCLKMLQQILGPATRLEVETCATLLYVSADRNQIQQVLINLALNARDAMPNGGRLTIRTRQADPGTAEISVVDTGMGMTEETQERLFEPFFSRKGIKGTGLGMTIVHSIVTKWG